MIATIKPILVDLATVSQVVALSQSTVQALVRDSDFPKPRQMSGRRVAWLLREVEAWAESRPVSVLPPPENTGAKKPKAARQQDPQDNLIAA